MAEVSDIVIVKLDPQVHRTTFTDDSAPIAETFTPTGPCELLEIRVHLSAAGGAANWTTTLDSANGAAYDTVLQTIDMTSVPDFWLTDVKVFLALGDALVFAWANGATRTVGIEVVWRAF